MSEDLVMVRLRQLGLLGNGNGESELNADDEFLRYMRRKLSANEQRHSAPTSSDRNYSSSNINSTLQIRAGNSGVNHVNSISDREGEYEPTSDAIEPDESADCQKQQSSEPPDLTLTQAKGLLLSALASPISPPQQQQIVANLKAAALTNDDLLHHLPPSRLPELVEHNPLVAIELLLRILPVSSSIAQPNDGVAGSETIAYLDALGGMELSLPTIDVVNRLTIATTLPDEFLHTFIHNGIVSCGRIGDKYLQNRLVRLVCVFLQSLLRNKVLAVARLSVEIQAFCVEFSRIREAASLYRLLKAMEV